MFYTSGLTDVILIKFCSTVIVDVVVFVEQVAVIVKLPALTA